MDFIDLKSQYREHKEEIDAAIHRVLDHGCYILGPEVKELEQKLAHYAGVKHCLTVSSGTDALLMALMAYGVGPGHEVITVPFTFVATADVIALLGAKPVFVDIDPDTYNIDVTQLERAITPRTKAIMPVDLFGQMADYSKINAIADKYGIPVIQDAAQSFGATQNGRKSCAMSAIGATSFYPAKPLGCYGDGGALFTDDDNLAHTLLALRTYGGVQRHHYPSLGINGRFDTIQAAIMLVKLKYFDAELEARNQIAARYDFLLKGHCAVPPIATGNTHSYAQYTIRVHERDRFVQEMAKAGIPTSLYYPKCLHEQPCFDYLGYGAGSFPVAEKAAREVVSLPMHPYLTAEQQEKICQKIAELTPVSV